MQVSRRNKLTAYYDLQDRYTGHWFIGQGGIFGLTTPEASWVQTTPINHLWQAKYTSMTSSRMLLEAGVSTYTQEYTRLPQPGTSPTASSVVDTTTGRRINAAPYYSEHWSTLRTYVGSLSYVTGSHAFKAGFNMSEGPRHEKATVNNDMTLVFNGATPVQATLTASPRNARERLNADLGVYAQDQWTIDRLTLNLGLRLDYLNAKLEAQNFPAGTFVPVRTLGELTDLPSWKDINPRLGFAYDLRGNGKTAIKASVSRYVASQTVGFANQFNPLGGTITGAVFSGAGADPRTWTDPNGDRIVQLSELGPTNNPAFGTAVLVTNPSPDVKEGWFKRGFNWEYSVGVQRELKPRVSANLAFFRRRFGNYTRVDALQVTSSDYTPYCIMAPNDPRLPNSGQPVCGLFDPTPIARPLSAIDRLVDFADSQNRWRTFNGFDYTTSARVRDKLLVSGGGSSGLFHDVSCEIVDSPDLRFCDNRTPWLSQAKLLAAYSLPFDLLVSGTFQSFPGPPLEARWSSVTNAIANAGPMPLGRNLSAGRPTTRDGAYVSLIQHNTMYGDRLNQVDFRLARFFRLNTSRLQAMVDVYNVFNNSPVLAYNLTYGQEWLRPTDVLQGRLVKLGGQLIF